MVAADTSLKSLDEINGLDALWAAVTAFNISFWLNLWAFEIRKKPLISIISPGDNYESAPLFALIFGTLVTLVSVSLFVWRVRMTASEPIFSRVPPLWINIDFGSSVGRLWRTVILVMAVVLPVGLQGYFWVHFSKRQAWTNTANAIKIDLWQPVSPTHLFVGFNDFRYGFFDERANKLQDFGGVSFVPFWEPALMVVLSIASGILVYRLIRGLVAAPRRSGRRR